MANDEGRKMLLDIEHGQMHESARRFRRIVLFTDKLLMAGFIALIAYLTLYDNEYPAFLIIFNFCLAGVWFLCEVHACIIIMMPGRHIKTYRGEVFYVRGLSKLMACIIACVPNFYLANEEATFIQLAGCLLLMEAFVHLLHFLLVDIDVINNDVCACCKDTENIEVKRAREHKKKITGELDMLEAFMTGKKPQKKAVDDDDDDDGDDDED